MELSSQRQFSLNFVGKTLKEFFDDYTEILKVVKDYANKNGFSFDEGYCFKVFAFLMDMTLLREESKWPVGGDFWKLYNLESGTYKLMGDSVRANRSKEDYEDSYMRLAVDVKMTYEKYTKTAMYVLFYVFCLYRKIRPYSSIKFPDITSFLPAANNAFRGVYNAKTLTNNYIYDATYDYGVEKRYDAHLFYRWIATGFICEVSFHNED